MRQPQLNADSLETGLNKSGPELLDDVLGQVHASQLVHFGLLRGSVVLSDLSTIGDGAEGLGRFSPGVDQSSAIDIPKSFAGDGVYARRPASSVDAPKINVLADIPERLKYTTGRASLFDVARYSVALCTAVAAKAGAPLHITLAGDTGSKVVLDSTARDGYIAMEAVDNIRSVKQIPNAGTHEVFRNALDELSQAANVNEDVIFIAGDLMSGFDKLTGEFNWEEALENLNNEFGDRLLMAWLRSPAQQLLPVGISDSLRIDDIRKIRRNHEEIANQKSKRIESVVKYMRFAEIDANNTYPTKLQLSDFILSKP